MTINEFTALLLTADPDATHYIAAEGQTNYTVWRKYTERRLAADGESAGIIHLIQVDRFTKIEDDPMVDSIRAALEHPDISFDYQEDFEPDTLYIHHVFDCEVAE